MLQFILEKAKLETVLKNQKNVFREKTCVYLLKVNWTHEDDDATACCIRPKPQDHSGGQPKSYHLFSSESQMISCIWRRSASKSNELSQTKTEIRVEPLGSDHLSRTTEPPKVYHHTHEEGESKVAAAVESLK